MAAPLVRGKRIYRICQECGEFCMCHEDTCPNCIGTNTRREKIADTLQVLEDSIRCRFRYEQLS